MNASAEKEVLINSYLDLVKVGESWCLGTRAPFRMKEYSVQETTGDLVLYLPVTLLLGLT